MPRLIAPIVLALALAGVVPADLMAGAHHGEAGSLGTVRITQPVMAGGVMLQPGTYEVRDTGQHTMPMPGQSANAQARIEFVQNGRVVATDVAEVMESEAGAVGTSGGTSGWTSGGNSRLRFESLKGGDFARVSGTRAGARYLIHLPLP